MIQFLPGIVIMGVSGCGKSTLGQRLAADLGCRFIEGDDLHPQANIDKMASGIALDDDDRWPWLKRVASELSRPAGQAADQGCVVSCSALKRSYRDAIRREAGVGVLFVYLEVPAATLHDRLVQRPGHYMPASLLDSQLATLQAPTPDEGALTLDGTQPVKALAAAVMTRLAADAPGESES
ncbi:gluconokinase [Asticcacaulis sp. EMRT-3]|uniref:gluconokinase n=1 Tax=Asticcacaulis sp. EMRT-3 TaxID=3040349 RepID=UPI0024AF5DF5|nr:gluconokinase [Asticcacaulis sp. EMRT-3]MDI7776635.1 gluconokinase [Asticcacaulis sp. EMRT-3]